MKNILSSDNNDTTAISQLLDGWRDVLKNARLGVSAGSRSISDMDTEQAIAFPLLDHIEDELDALSEKIKMAHLASRGEKYVSLSDAISSEMESGGKIKSETLCPRYANLIVYLRNSWCDPEAEFIGILGFDY